MCLYVILTFLKNSFKTNIITLLFVNIYVYIDICVSMYDLINVWLCLHIPFRRIQELIQSQKLRILRRPEVLITQPISGRQIKAETVGEHASPTYNWGFRTAVASGILLTLLASYKNPFISILAFLLVSHDCLLIHWKQFECSILK